MGRVKTQIIKRATKRLISEHSKEFMDSFEENKRLLGKFADIPSRKLRNILAGYITRQMKCQKLPCAISLF